MCLQLTYRYTVSVSAADIQVHSLVCLQLIYRYYVSVSAVDILLPDRV